MLFEYNILFNRNCVNSITIIFLKAFSSLFVMAEQGVLEKEAKKYILDKIHAAVESSPDSDFAKLILYSANRDNFYLNFAPKMFQVCQKKFEETFNYLLDSGIVMRGNKGRGDKRYDCIKNDESVNEYLSSELPYGLGTIIKREGVEDSVVLEAMNSVKDIVEFQYSRNFIFKDLSGLDKLRKQSHEALKQIRKAEEKYWYEQLGIPKQYGNFSSFVSENNSTNSRRRFNFYGEFSSPNEAFRVGFGEARGGPRASRIYNKGYCKNNLLPFAIEVRKDEKGYKISLENICYSVIVSDVGNGESNLDYLLEAKKVMPVLQERMERVLGKS